MTRHKTIAGGGHASHKGALVHQIARLATRPWRSEDGDGPDLCEHEIEVKWRVLPSFVASLFDNATWETLPGSADALKVLKVLGYRYIPSGPKVAATALIVAMRED